MKSLSSKRNERANIYGNFGGGSKKVGLQRPLYNESMSNKNAKSIYTRSNQKVNIYDNFA